MLGFLQQKTEEANEREIWTTKEPENESSMNNSYNKYKWIKLSPHLKDMNDPIQF